MLYETDRLREKTTPREQIIYRIQVEGIVGQDDHLHRFEWVRKLPVTQLTSQDDELRRLGIQLLNKEDLTLDQATTREEQWAYYVDSYYMHADTEGVPTDMLAPPWLRRSAPSDLHSDQAQVLNELQVKICLNTYKLFYLVNTEDALVRNKGTRSIKTKQLGYNRAGRKSDGKKWTQDGYHTKEAEDAAAAAAEAREQIAVPHPATITPSTPTVTQGGSPPAAATSATPAPQTETLRSTDPTPNPPAVVPEEIVHPSSDVKVESPPLPVESGEAMDVEPTETAPAAVPEASTEEPVKPGTEDVEMTDA